MILSLQTITKKLALNTNVSAQGATGGIVEFSANPSLGYMSKIDPKVSLEAFDARNLEELRAFSVIFAFSAAIQDEFGEAFFQTITLSPDSTGLEVSQRRTMVQQEIRHPLTGEAVDWKQRNLLDAISDPTIVINEATRIYPQVLIGNAKSEQHFVDAAVIAPAPALGAGGAKINVAPLKAGAKVNLLGAGANDRTNGTRPKLMQSINALRSKLYTYASEQLLVNQSFASILVHSLKMVSTNHLKAVIAVSC